MRPLTINPAGDPAGSHPMSRGAGDRDLRRAHMQTYADLLILGGEHTMREGLLWFDNDPTVQLKDKIQQAAQRYRLRLKRSPTVCYLNTEQFSSDLETVNGITVKPASYIRPHYLWIGVESEPLPPQAA